MVDAPVINPTLIGSLRILGSNFGVKAIFQSVANTENVIVIVYYAIRYKPDGGNHKKEHTDANKQWDVLTNNHIIQPISDFSNKLSSQLLNFLSVRGN